MNGNHNLKTKQNNLLSRTIPNFSLQIKKTYMIKLKTIVEGKSVTQTYQKNKEKFNSSSWTHCKDLHVRFDDKDRLVGYGKTCISWNQKEIGIHHQGRIKSRKKMCHTLEERCMKMKFYHIHHLRPQKIKIR